MYACKYHKLNKIYCLFRCFDSWQLTIPVHRNYCNCFCCCTCIKLLLRPQVPLRYATAASVLFTWSTTTAAALVVVLFIFAKLLCS